MQSNEKQRRLDNEHKLQKLELELAKEKKLSVAKQVRKVVKP